MKILQDSYTLVFASDIHYPGPQERQRHDYEFKIIKNPIQRLLVKGYRHYIWLKDPFAHSYMLDRMLAQTPPSPDIVVILGDLSCDSAFVGVSDPAAYESTCLCIDKLKSRFGNKVKITFGDHDIGKTSLVGGIGGPRLRSWYLLTEEMGLEDLWIEYLGQTAIIGIASTIVALPVFIPEILKEELPQWIELRNKYLQRLIHIFETLTDHTPIILCLHDPTALPYLLEIRQISEKLPQIKVTVIGHLHTHLILRTAKFLAGMPQIRFLGNTIRRMTTGLQQARIWKKFKLQLCPSLTGIELLKYGGFLILYLNNNGSYLKWELKRLVWK